LIYPARPIPDYFYPTLILSNLILVVIFQLNGLYQFQPLSNANQQIKRIFKSFFTMMVTFVTIIFFLKTHYLSDSRLIVGSGLVIGLILSLLIRVGIVPKIFKLLLSRGYCRKRTLIYGAGEHGRQVVDILEENSLKYFDLCGFIDDDTDKMGTTIAGLPVLGEGKNLETIIKELKIDNIIIAINAAGHGTIQNIEELCKNAQVITHIVSNLYSEVTQKLEADEYGGLQTYRIIFQQPGIVRYLSKRGLDILGSAVFLLLLTPFFLLIALLIKRDSPGPVFYSRRVVGKGGKTFIMYKFRTMIAYNDDSQHIEFMKRFINGDTNNECYLKKDNRITKVGSYLRKWSIDELPQLWNVLKGDMSLVGPRFCNVDEYKFYKPWYKKRTAVKPGLTGIWQVRARSAVSYDDMVILDIYYIENMSLWLDLEILLRTIPVVLFGRGSRV
jgi:exopolysaccharide biosynthesis polyprenyl glycosylphosphotransferase